MLLCEQERILTSEKNLLTENNLYSTVSGSLVLIHDYGNIVVPAGGALVYFNANTFLSTIADPNATALADFILKVGGNTIAGKHIEISGTPPLTGNKTDPVGSIVWFNAGTYDVSLYGRSDSTATIAAVQGIQFGITSFNDLVYSAFQVYSNPNPANIALTVAARQTPLGPLKQAVYALTIAGNQAWGAGLTVQVDGVTQTTPDEDGGTGGTGIYVYKLFVPLSVGTSHTISIISPAGTINASVVACPWILSITSATVLRNGHSPVTLDFSQLSTMYTNLGSLFYDSTKNAYLGVVKAVSFSASDYYAHGIAEVGILSFNYNFSSLNVFVASFIVDGLGSCIENIGVDIA
jgi:hypothetical protein